MIVEVYVILMCLGPLLASVWLLDRAWRLQGRDLKGLDPYRLLLVPILVTALFSASTGAILIRIAFLPRRFPFPWLALVWLPPLACLIPKVGRELKWAAGLAAVPVAGILAYRLWTGSWDDHSFLSTLLLVCGTVVIVRCATLPADEDPQRVYRDRLPLQIICAVCGLAIVSLVFVPWDGGRSNRILWPDFLGLLALPGLIPAFGKRPAVVIACTSLALIPAVLWAVLLGMRLAGR